MKFTELNLSETILKAIATKGYETPTPIQAQSIKAVLAGKDVMAAAQTGTGKTAAFVLPILELLSKGGSTKSNHARVLILTPTRELAAQVNASIETYGKYGKLSSAVVFGGVGINPQMKKLRKGVDILVATPGRLMDLYERKSIKFGQIEILVLDEADRMLDMGFIRDIRKILAVLPNARQSLLFSATFSKEIRTLAKGIMKSPVEISVTPRNTTVDAIDQWVYPVDQKRKPSLLTKLIKDNDWQQVLVFCRTKHGANRLTEHLGKNRIKAMAIHGNKSQGARTKALDEFKKGNVRILVATDIAARGIDIAQLPHVVNFDLPNVSEDYVHRIGRTGRAGEKGEAVSLVCESELKELSDIERLIKQVIPRKIVEGFESKRPLKITSLDDRPIKSNRPKNRKRSNTNSRSNSTNQSRRPKNSNFGKRKQQGSGSKPTGSKTR
jgi:ATP-dependent RNA helicase RhlE